jgi:hypothetical protein
LLVIPSKYDRAIRPRGPATPNDGLVPAYIADPATRLAKKRPGAEPLPRSWRGLWSPESHPEPGLLSRGRANPGLRSSRGKTTNGGRSLLARRPGDLRLMDCRRTRPGGKRCHKPCNKVGKSSLS